MWSRGSGSEAQPRTGDCPLGIALAAGFATGTGGCVLVSLVVPAHEMTVRLVILSVCVAGYAVVVPSVLGAFLTAVMAWFMYLGFLVERAGELRWHGSVDLLRLGTLMVAALLGSAWRPIAMLLSEWSEPLRGARPRVDLPATSSLAGDRARVRRHHPAEHPADRQQA